MYSVDCRIECSDYLGICANMGIVKKTGLRLNSPGPLTDDWKVMDDSSVNFHDVFFFIFCQIIAKNEEKHIMEMYG